MLRCLSFAYHSRKELFNSAASLGKNIESAISDMTEAREENRICDSDPTIRKALVTDYNKNSPTLLKIQDPPTTASCAAIKATIKMSRDLKIAELNGSILRKQMAGKSLSAQEQEYADFRNQLPQEGGADIIALAKDKLHKMNIQVQCYNDFSAAVMTCEAAAAVATLGSGPAAAAIKAAKLGRILKFAGVGAKTEEVALATKPLNGKSSAYFQDTARQREQALKEYIMMNDGKAGLRNLALARQREAVRARLEKEKQTLTKEQEQLLNENVFTEVKKSSDGILANGVMVTGDRHYPLNLVKDHLKLNEQFLNKLPENANILSVGEGTSDLAPTLATRFPNTKQADYYTADMQARGIKPGFGDDRGTNNDHANPLSGVLVGV